MGSSGLGQRERGANEQLQLAAGDPAEQLFTSAKKLGARLNVVTERWSADAVRALGKKEGIKRRDFARRLAEKDEETQGSEAVEALLTE
eukprot:TRINITY_DN3722_c0_g1_i1.p1 TRINITY_DN3722_c0_g1~~TRINITY_DN3722_c0_g1_i1.p1  ORF type:complete len:89 (+),score=15.75 TRINITY_DN3722_c0_g1_i1:88-354(+)